MPIGGSPFTPLLWHVICKGSYWQALYMQFKCHANVGSYADMPYCGLKIAGGRLRHALLWPKNCRGVAAFIGIYRYFYGHV